MRSGRLLGIFLLWPAMGLADEPEASSATGSDPAPAGTEASPETPAPSAEPPAAPTDAPAAPTDASAAPADAPAPPAEEAEKPGWVSAGGDAGRSPTTELNAWDALERLPPAYSGDLAVVVSYGDITYHSDLRSYYGMDPGFGIRGAWGKHYGANRLGLHFNGAVEGPAPIYFSTVFEVLPSWDLVRHNVQLGASIGPALMLHSSLEDGQGISMAPALGLRMGYSQGWSRVSRRFFVVLEPKVRLVKGRPQLMASVLIGQGRGR